MTDLPPKEQARLRHSRPWYLAGYLCVSTCIGFWLVSDPADVRPKAVVAGIALAGLLIEIFSFLLKKRADLHLVGRLAALAALAVTPSALFDLEPLVALALGPIILITLALGVGSGIFAALAAVAALAVGALDPEAPLGLVLPTLIILSGVPLGKFLERYFSAETAPPPFSDLIGFENVTEGVIVTDAQHKVYYLNPAAAVTTRWNREEAPGLPLATLLPLDDTKSRPIDQELEVALESGQPHTLRGRLISRVAPGRILRLSISPLPERRGAVILLRDVTAETAEEETQLEFASTVSHELRTPLAAISGYLELLKNSKNLPKKEADQVEKAYAASRHISRLLQRFLRTTQIGHKQIQAVVLSPVEVEPLLNAVVEEFQIEARDRGLELGWDQEPGEVHRPVPAVLADRDRLREVLENLVGNALKFTEKGSVTVGARPEGEGVAIWVTDTGIGIAPEDQTHIFEQYYRAETTFTQARGGTGLGLYISHSLAKSMGGHIEVTSEVGKGSTFTVHLRAARAQAAPAASPTTDTAAT
jgi:PAS domain S-box-containing protein